MPQDIQKHVGKGIRDARRRQRLTQGQLAARAALSPKVLGEIERGTGNPTVSTLANLSQALGVAMPHLVADVPLAATETGGRYLTAQELRRLNDALKTATGVVRGPSQAHARTIRRRR